jgi:hypothetical protein
VKPKLLTEQEKKRVPKVSENETKVEEHCLLIEDNWVSFLILSKNKQKWISLAMICFVQISDPLRKHFKFFPVPFNKIMFFFAFSKSVHLFWFVKKLSNTLTGLS